MDQIVDPPSDDTIPDGLPLFDLNDDVLPPVVADAGDGDEKGDTCDGGSDVRPVARPLLHDVNPKSLDYDPVEDASDDDCKFVCASAASSSASRASSSASIKDAKRDELLAMLQQLQGQLVALNSKCLSTP